MSFENSSLMAATQNQWWAAVFQSQRDCGTKPRRDVWRTRSRDGLRHLPSWFMAPAHDFEIVATTLGPGPHGFQPQRGCVTFLLPGRNPVGVVCLRPRYPG